MNFSTPCASEVRQLGFLRKSIGLWSRYRRCRREWQGHLQSSQALVKSGISRCEHLLRDPASGGGHAVILGSGFLYDVPLEELCESFSKVSLVDVLHPNEVRRRVAEFPQVELVSLDLTGTVTSLVRLQDMMKGWKGDTTSASDQIDLPSPSFNLPEKLQDADYLVSLNLLSQLPLLPTEFAEQKLGVSKERCEAWGSEIIKAHLEGLRARSRGVVALIHDRQRFGIAADASTVYQWDPLFGVNPEDYLCGGAGQNDVSAPLLSLLSREWTWKTAPFGEVHREFKGQSKSIAANGAISGSGFSSGSAANDGLSIHHRVRGSVFAPAFV